MHQNLPLFTVGNINYGKNKFYVVGTRRSPKYPDRSQGTLESSTRTTRSASRRECPDYTKVAVNDFHFYIFTVGLNVDSSKRQQNQFIISASFSFLSQLGNKFYLVSDLLATPILNILLQCLLIKTDRRKYIYLNRRNI